MLIGTEFMKTQSTFHSNRIPKKKEGNSFVLKTCKIKNMLELFVKTTYKEFESDLNKIKTRQKVASKFWYKRRPESDERVSKKAVDFQLAETPLSGDHFL